MAAPAPTNLNPPPQNDSDPAFEQAVQNYTQNLEEPFRSRILQLQGTSAEQVIAKAEELDRRHGTTSRSRRIVVRLAPCLKAFTQFGSIVSTFTSYAPDPTSLVWSGVMCVLQVGSEYPSYFEKITALFESFAGVLRPLSRYSRGMFKTDAEMQKVG